MFLQPTLTGKWVQLSPTIPGDHDALYAAASDPLIWEQHPANDRWQPEVFDKFFTAGLASGGALTARDVADGTVIGSSRYYAWSEAERHLSIGFTFLARRCWGGTYNKEMKQLMIDHAFTQVDRVWFHIGVDNIRSRRAISAIGASLDREVPKDPAWAGVSMAYYFLDSKR